MQKGTCVKVAIVLSFLLCFYGVCRSQTYKYHFRIINLPENFQNQYISLVDEDAAGMLWFVTTSGLHRYDGNQVLTFDMQSTPALPDVEISSLVADSLNRLWLVIRGKLVCFDLQQWRTRLIPFQRRPATLQDDGITALAEDKDGTLYAGCGSGLYRVTQDSLELVTRIEKQATHSPGRFFIDGIHKPRPDQLLLTTSNGEVVSIRHRQTTFARPVPVKLQHTANDFVQSSTAIPLHNYLLNVTGTGACMVDLNRMVATSLGSLAKNFSLENSNYFISALTELGSNQAILFNKALASTEIGMLIYNPEQNTFEDLSKIYPAALKSNQLRHLGYKNGHILIPSKGGIATVSYTSSALDVFAASLENANSVRSIYKMPDGHLLIGSYLYHFSQFDEASSTIVNLAGHFVYCMQHWGNDTLLIGTEGAGLNWYLPATNRFISLPGVNANEESIPSNILSLCRESDTSFWAGSNAGFYLVNPYTQHILNSSKQEKGQPLQQSTVSDILKVGSSRFFATREGLFKYNVIRKSWTKLLTTSAGNYANSQFSCLRLANNQIWAGTVGNGMLVLDTTGVLLRNITTAEGLANNNIFSNPLCKNYMFVGTLTGLSIINLLSGKISNYSSEYYLPADEFNRSAWYVAGDTVYMGTINGLIRIDINQLQQQQAAVAPGICFSSFAFSNGSTNGADYTLPYRKDISLTIPPDVNNFSVAFGGFSEVAEGLQLFYRLKANEPWQTIGKRREITFVNIAPDEYTMQIAARLPDGQWRENILMLPITVQPHFYQTWWWKILLLAVALGLIWLGIKYREGALRKEERLRSRIAGDLHDEVGSALTRIYFQAGMLTSRDIKAEEPPTVALEHIAYSSKEALSSMSDMVWSIDAHYDNAVDMVDRMRDYIARLQDELDCSCTFSVAGDYEGLRLSQVVRQNILLIFKEAVNNAIKYGSKETIVVHLLLNKNAIELKVANKVAATVPKENGVQGGHGMKSMQLRADKIGAKLSVTHTNEEFILQLEAKPF